MYIYANRKTVKLVTTEQFISIPGQTNTHSIQLYAINAVIKCLSSHRHHITINRDRDSFYYLFQYMKNMILKFKMLYCYICNLPSWIRDWTGCLSILNTETELICIVFNYILIIITTE